MAGRFDPAKNLASACSFSLFLSLSLPLFLARSVQRLICRLRLTVEPVSAAKSARRYGRGSERRFEDKQSVRHNEQKKISLINKSDLLNIFRAVMYMSHNFDRRLKYLDVFGAYLSHFFF